jgi:hypothetical protein
MISGNGDFVAFTWVGVDAADSPIWVVDGYDVATQATKIISQGTGGNPPSASGITADGNSTVLGDSTGIWAAHADGTSLPLSLSMIDGIAVGGVDAVDAQAVAQDGSSFVYEAWTNPFHHWVVKQDVAGGTAQIIYDADMSPLLGGLENAIVRGGNSDLSVLLIAGVDPLLGDHVRHLYRLDANGVATLVSVDPAGLANTVELQRGAMSPDSTTVAWATGGSTEPLLLRGPTYPGE